MTGIRRLYIGGLFTGVNESDINDQFGKFGDIEKVDIINRDDSKTFAYININISDQNLQKFLNIYKNATWKGEILQVQIARESYFDKLAKERKGSEFVSSEKSYSNKKEKYLAESKRRWEDNEAEILVKRKKNNFEDANFSQQGNKFQNNESETFKHKSQNYENQNHKNFDSWQSRERKFSSIPKPVRYDPNRPEHKIYEISASKADVERNIEKKSESPKDFKKDTKISCPTNINATAENRFWFVKNDLKDSFEKQSNFSFSKMFDNYIINSQEASSKENSKYLFQGRSYDKNEFTELEENDEYEDRSYYKDELPELEEKYEHEDWYKDFSKNEPYKKDYSENNQSELVKNYENMKDMLESKKKYKDVAENSLLQIFGDGFTNEGTFFFTENGFRIKAGFNFFKRTMDLEDLKKEWNDKRLELLQDFHKKKKRLLRHKKLKTWNYVQFKKWPKRKKQILIQV